MSQTLVFVWTCQMCGHRHPSYSAPDGRCVRCRAQRLPVFQTEQKILYCKQCGEEQPVNANFCPKCGLSMRASRLIGGAEHPKAPDTHAIRCFLPKCPTLVLAQPDLKAERLYSVDVGDVLSIMAEQKPFYKVLLPGTETGYILQAIGLQVDVGVENVRNPLGYVRVLKNGKAQGLSLPQPDGRSETLYAMKDTDRLPVVEELETTFIVQLPNRIRGEVHKAQLIRTLSSDSLPDIPADPSTLDAILGVAALVALGAASQAVEHYQQEERIKRGVQKAL